MSLRLEISEVLENIAKDGLPNPRDLDVALDAIFCSMEQYGFRDEVIQEPDNKPDIPVHNPEILGHNKDMARNKPDNVEVAA